MCAPELLEVDSRRQIRAGADDVLERAAGIRQRLLDALEAALGLAVRVRGRVGVVGMIAAQPATKTRSPTRTARE